MRRSVSITDDVSPRREIVIPVARLSGFVL